MKAHQLEFKLHEGDLLEEVCSEDTLRKAFKLVKRNKGAPGIDGKTIEDFEQNLSEEITQLKQEVLSWRYKPTPVKRVEIPKPDGKGVRLLGIPIIKDRVLNMAIKMVLEPIVKQQKRRRNLFHKLIKQGVEKKMAAKSAYSNRGTWNLSHTRAVEKAYPNEWFERAGLKIISNLGLEHWMPIDMWVKLT